jgi:hypothetical protein
LPHFDFSDLLLGKPLAGGLGVGVAVPPATHTTKKPRSRRGFPCGRLLVVRHAFDVLADIAELVVQILSCRLNLVFDFGETGIDARFGGVNPFLKPTLDSPFRKFDAKCLACGSYQLRLVAQIWESIDKIWRSSASLDLRQYMKYVGMVVYTKLI